MRPGGYVTRGGKFHPKTPAKKKRYPQRKEAEKSEQGENGDSRQAGRRVIGQGVGGKTESRGKKGKALLRRRGRASKKGSSPKGKLGTNRRSTAEKQEIEIQQREENAEEGEKKRRRRDGGHAEISSKQKGGEKKEKISAPNTANRQKRKIARH